MVLNLFDMVEQIKLGPQYFDSSSHTSAKKKPALRVIKRINREDREESRVDNKADTKRKNDENENKVEIRKPETSCNKVGTNDKADRSSKDNIINILDDFSDDNNSGNENKEGIDLKLGVVSESYSALVNAKQYQQLLDQYRRFLEGYLKGANNVAMPQYNYENNNGSEGREFKWGEEVATYHEIKDTIRKVKMNLLLGGWHNPVSWQAVQDYKFWKYVSKFNKVMADVIEAGVGSGG